MHHDHCQIKILSSHNISTCISKNKNIISVSISWEYVYIPTRSREDKEEECLNYSFNKKYDIVRHVSLVTWRLDACMCTLYIYYAPSCNNYVC